MPLLPSPFPELDAKAVQRSMRELSFAGSTPLILVCSFPFSKYMKVGILLEISHTQTPGRRHTYVVMLYCWAMTCWFSVLTLVKVTVFCREYFVERPSYIGAMVLQGPHQSA